MKHSFLRLISSFYILLISALMIVISAYAWMVISDSPAAGGIGFGIAGLDQWDIPEAEYKEPDQDAYDYMDGIRWTAEDVAADIENAIFQKDENGTYIVDSAEKFVAIMEYVNGNTALNGPVRMRLTTHISLEDHQMQSRTVEISTAEETLTNDETETSETQETVSVFWKADEWNPVKIAGYTGTGCITIEVDSSLKENAELNGTAYIKGLAKPLFYGGFAGNSGIDIRDITIYDSHMLSSSSDTGSGAFIETVDSMPTITLKNCHLLASSIDKERTDGKYSRVGGLIGWTSGYSKQTDGPVKTYITIEDCSVQGCTLVGTSVGGINGHAGASDWTYTTIKNCTVIDNELHSLDGGDWRVGEIVGTANAGQVTIIDAFTENNIRLQTGKNIPTDRPCFYGRAVLNGTGSVMILDNIQDNYGEAYVLGEFIPGKEQELTATNQYWFVHGAVKLKEEVRFQGQSVSIEPYMFGDGSITFESVATGLSYPGSPDASAGFNFAERDAYIADEMDKVRAEKGSEINFTKIQFINQKTLGKVDKYVSSRRHPYSMYALAENATYTDCSFEGSLVVYNSAAFTNCVFTEDVENRYCLFFDDVFDPENGTYLIQDCSFTAASTAYGCVKISEDGSLSVDNGADVGGTYMIKNSIFNNAANEGKPAVYVNGYANIITDGNNKIFDDRGEDRAGGILAKHLEISDADYHTYATYHNILTDESRYCLTIDQYNANKADYDTTEFGVNGLYTPEQPTLNEDEENGETVSKTETTETTTETMSASISETTTAETAESSTIESTEETQVESTSASETTAETTVSEIVSSAVETTAETTSENAEQNEHTNEPAETEEIVSESETEETESTEPSGEENAENISSEMDPEESSSESTSEEENAV